MSREPWGHILCLGIGTVIGTISGYFISKKLFKPEVQSMPDHDEIVTYYEAKIRELIIPTTLTPETKKEEKELAPITMQNKVPAAALETNGVPKKIEEYQPKITEKDYKSYNKMYAPKDGSELKIREDVSMEKTDPWPHKITNDEWLQNKNYSKVSLIYYEIDGMFATTGDEPTDYTEEYFGIHNINEFGASSNSGMGHDSWTLMLRDELTRTDFQILYDGSTSWETVWQNTGGAKD